MKSPFKDSNAFEISGESAGKVLSKLQIIKNLVVVALACLFLFTSGIIVLLCQSTLNTEDNVGIVSMAVHYAATILASLFLPKYLVLKFGSKNIMLLGVVLFLPFIGANFYPLYYLMVLTSTVLGAAYAVFWGALDPYINTLASLYADHQKEDLKERETRTFHVNNENINVQSQLYGAKETYKPINNFQSEIFSITKNMPDNNTCIKTEIKNIPDANIGDPNLCHTLKDLDGTANNQKGKNILESTTVLFFGFHSMMYQTYYILSNLTSYYVLQDGYNVNQTSIYLKESCVCGASYCNVETACMEQQLQQPSPEARNVLFTMCITFCIVSGLLVLFLDDLERKVDKIKFSLNVLMATYKEIKKKRHLLLMPLTVYIGMMQGFYLGDFTKSYIGCGWGVQYVGLVTTCAGVTMALFSTLSGWFTKKLGRMPIFLMAAMLNVVLNLTLLFWQPNASSQVVFFATAGLWGCLFGVFYTQVRAFYGVLFKADEEAAFGAFHLWYCFGCCLCLSYSDYFCNDVKIYLLIVASTLGLIGYLVVERRHAAERELKAHY